MKILVVSASPWNNNNSFGISYSNIFKGIDGLEFANVSFSRRLEQTDDEIVSRSFQVTTKMLINNLLKREKQLGIEGHISTENHNKQNIEQTSVMKFAKRKRWKILFWLNDLIWSLGHWKSQELMDFIDDFQPDLIVQPIYFSSYLNDIAQFIKNYTKVPMIGYISDDCYTLKQFSLSPLYWIDRLYKRRKVKETIEQCELLYVISDVQKREYEKIFTPPCKILTKCADFSDERKPAFKEPDEVLKMVYAGNVSRGRYEILVELAKAIEKLNSNGKKFQLDIYTLTFLTDKQKNNIVTEDVRIHPPVSYEEIREIQSNSDILLHVEAFSLKEKLAVHQSFSTKIVDYLETNRCIFAIGDDYCASIQYFLENKCGAVATKKENIETELSKLHSNRELLKQFAYNGWEIGGKNHKKKSIQAMITGDLNYILNNK